MKSIEVRKINKIDNTISYDFLVSNELSCFFSGKEFRIEYPENIENVPDSVAVIPFVCNVLPIIWLTDSQLIIKEIDRDFYESIPNFKKGYETMFPESKFLGEVIVSEIVDCTYQSEEKCAAFFSGGLDAVQTLVSHLEENPTLISVWGSDIQYENTDGWSKVYSLIKKNACEFNVPCIVIRSTFREFDNEARLDAAYHKKLQDGWWHGVKHGIGLLGHAAPYIYLHKISRVYIASTNCAADGKVRCASNPLIDNYVEFTGCKVVHDGFEYSRQDKVKNVVEFCNKTKKNIYLHVCWITQAGNNCCQCEKCYRTIAGLLVEGGAPENYGFTDYKKTLKKMQQYIVEVARYRNPECLIDYWTHIQTHALKNEKMLKRKSYYSEIKWILTTDFKHPDRIKMPFNYYIRLRLSRFKFYQLLHELKVKIKEKVK